MHVYTRHCLHALVPAAKLRLAPPPREGWIQIHVSFRQIIGQIITPLGPEGTKRLPLVDLLQPSRVFFPAQDTYINLPTRAAIMVADAGRLTLTTRLLCDQTDLQERKCM